MDVLVFVCSGFSHSLSHHMLTVFPRLNAPVRVGAPARFSASPPPPPPHKTSNLISATVRVSAPSSDKRLLQISLDFDQKDGEPELFLNQLTVYLILNGYHVKLVLAI